MTRNEQIQFLGDLLCKAWSTGQRLSLPAGNWQDLTLADGNAVQKHVANRLGWFPDGHPKAWKLGGSPAAGPAAAPVAGNALIFSPGAIPGDFSTTFGIEAEIAVRLGRDVPAGASAAEILQAIADIAPCIELCEMRLADAESLPPPLARADQHWNRALVLGAFTPLPASPAWGGFEVCVQVDGKLQHHARASHPFGNPLSSLAWLAGHAAQEWDGLHAGDVIATGSWSGLYWAAPGETVEISFNGLGKASLTIEASI